MSDTTSGGSLDRAIQENSYLADVQVGLCRIVSTYAQLPIWNAFVAGYRTYPCFLLVGNLTSCTPRDSSMKLRFCANVCLLSSVLNRLVLIYWSKILQRYPRRAHLRKARSRALPQSCKLIWHATILSACIVCGARQIHRPRSRTGV